MKRIKVTILSATILFCLLANITESFSQCNARWEWAKKFSGLNNDEYVKGSAIDKWGNIYVVGEFMGQSLVADSITLYKKGYGTAFIIKYSPNGKVIWAKAYGGGEEDIAVAVTVDKNGNVLLLGHFESVSIKFDTFSLTNFKEFNKTMFLVKLRPDGSVVWVKRAGNTKTGNDVYPGGVAVDSLGNVVTTGYWSNGDKIVIDGVVLNSNLNATSDTYIIRYDSNGILKWAKLLQNTGPTGVPVGIFGYSVATDNKCNVYTGGAYTHTLIVDTFHFYNGATYIYLIKYDSSGKVIWAKAAIGGSTPYCLKTDKSENLYVAGYAKPSVSQSFCIDTFKIKYFQGSFEGILIKIDSMGTVKWLKGIQGNKQEEVYSVALDAADNPYITGYYLGDSIRIDNIWIKRVGWYNAFVVKYTKDGKFKWVLNSKGTNSNTYVKPTGGCLVNNEGDVIVSGSFKIYNAIFGKDTLKTPDIYFTEGFITKIKSDLDVAPAVQPPLCKGDQNGSITLSGFSGTPPYSYSWQGGITGNKRTGLGAGSYVFTVSDSNNCSYTDTIVLTEPTAMHISMSIKDDSNNKKKGEATAVVTGGTPPYSYLWNDPSGQKTATASGLGAGNYTLTITDKNGCNTDTTIIIQNKVSVNDAESVYQMKVYPNPVTNGSFILEISSVQGIQVMYSLYDAMGKTVLEKNQIATDHNLKEEIIIQNKKPGIYHLQLTIGKDKLVKELLVY